VANRLAGETSPYLRQHRDNPVDWYPWGPEAQARARADDKPLLVSIGYSACHWCHVMAHESFEDPATAEVLNDRFVCVKVDREERPDVDAVYMSAVQALTGHGGWPLTAFCDPEGRPFFGGTYFPREPRPGLPSFVEVCRAVDDAWRTRRADVAEQAAALTDAVRRASEIRPSPEPLTSELLRTAVRAARETFDPVHGGFGRAPKFPAAMTLDLLIRAFGRDRAPGTAEMIRTTLDAMASGGLYDQLGGGFHRYSTDDVWLVPHFEKMLYDQALLARTYLHAFQLFGESRDRVVVEETVGYVLGTLGQEAGGFSSAEDADSEGVEGRFYVWTPAELEAVLGPEDAAVVAAYHGVTPGGNFEGQSILHVARRGQPRPPAVERARARLLAARDQRVRPGLDDKVLLAWNALFVATLAEAAAVLDRPDWLAAARRSTAFLLGELRRPDGRFLRSWQAGQARHLAYAEDYGALLELLVTMAEVDDVAWLGPAREVADELLRLFADPEEGGFFTTGGDAEALVVRSKDLFDHATPAGNSLAAVGLLRLSALSGERRYEGPAVGVLRLAGPALGQHPAAFGYLLGALEWYLFTPLEIAVVGDPEAGSTRALRRAVWSRPVPTAVRVTAAPGTGAEHTPLLADRAPPPGEDAVAFVCEHFACQLPTTSAAELTAQIDAALARR
jgi:uncharacterized protein YyaL (SSP411 family)